MTRIIALGGGMYIYIYIYIYHWFIVRFPIGLDFPFPGVLMKSIGAAVFFRPDALPDVNHMRGMQY